MIPTGVTPTLERLAGGDGRPVVVVDFAQFAAVGRLGPLLCAHRARQPIYQLDPVSDLAASGAYRPLAELADTYAAALAAVGAGRAQEARGVTLVGYCSAAALALEIAGRLARRCDACAVLVCPTWPDSAVIAADYASFRAGLGAAGAPGRPAVAGAGPPQRLADMRAQLARDLQAMAAASGLDGSSAVFADILARYSAWLGFLLACEATATRSRLPPFPVRVLSASEDGLPWPPSPRHRVSVLPVPERDLASSGAVAREILDHRWQAHG
jgi:hypothetical protein